MRQGDALSPTLFALYINDLAQEIKECSNDIKIGDEHCNILMYADDLALISDSESNLQNMLNVLAAWCTKWRMKVNVSKTKVVHYRANSQERSTVSFKYNNDTIEYVHQYL